MAKFTPEQVAEIVQREADIIDRENERLKFDKALKTLVEKAYKKGFVLGEIFFSICIR